MNRLGILLLAVALGALSGLATPLYAETARPNVVMILADDQGWGDLSGTGNRNLRTPHIDSLARDGARLERFYVCAVCSPTRAEMLTGRYHTRLGVTGTSAGSERLNAGETTLGDLFKAEGYATGAFGKWHNGLQWPYHPNARGFDEFYGFCSGHWGHYFSPELEHNGRQVEGDGYLTDDLTNRAITFIREHRGSPFFCYLPYNTPHSPMQVPDRFWAKFDGVDLALRHQKPERENLQHTRAALAMCENIDWNVGRLLRALDELGVAENTIVIYFSDNGPNGWRWNGGMRGRKGSTDEGGVRSPFFIRWPATIRPGTTIPQLAGAIDLLPTLAAVCGLTPTETRKLDGISLAPLLAGEATDWPARMYFSAWKGRVSVRTPVYRLDHEGRLYDMVRDPGQLHDISGELPDVAARLREAVSDWKKETQTPTPPRPFTVCHPGSPVTWLPARDGRAHGSIQRSSRHPNCSFFTHWTRPEDAITWDVEVIQGGTYEAEIHYTCARRNLGATLILESGNSRTQAEVAEPHDPPLLGEEHNRVPGTESYVKAFKPMTLGNLDLAAGRGTITLRASDIPGDEAADIRYLVLTRRDP